MVPRHAERTSVTVTCIFCHPNIMGPRKNGRHITEILELTTRKMRFVWNSSGVCLLRNKPALLKTMTWCKTGVTPLSESPITPFTNGYMHHTPSMSRIAILSIRIGILANMPRYNPRIYYKLTWWGWGFETALLSFEDWHSIWSVEIRLLDILSISGATGFIT